jgi:hypothetical protein
MRFLESDPARYTSGDEHRQSLHGDHLPRVVELDRAGSVHRDLPVTLQQDVQGDLGL